MYNLLPYKSKLGTFTIFQMSTVSGHYFEAKENQCIKIFLHETSTHIFYSLHTSTASNRPEGNITKYRK